MGHSTLIKSAQNGVTVEFFDRTANCYSVRVQGHIFHGTLCVYDDEQVCLAAFFNDLAENWRGWRGKREWGTLEGNMSLSATCDSLGHTYLSIYLCTDSDLFCGWSLSTTLLIEAGQLEHIAEEITGFIT
jgi:hypothetical protein